MDKENGDLRKIVAGKMAKPIKVRLQSRTLSVFLMGCMIGIVAFLCIFGVRVLNVTYVDWVFDHADLTQHYLGWQAYRQASWQVKFGLMDTLSFPYATSVIYTDSIPLCAVFFKVLSPILPQTFQYFGLWGLLCYALSGGLSALLLYRFCKDKTLCLIGSVFFVLAVPLMDRMFFHTALASQWILLLAIVLWVYDFGGTSLLRRCAAWAGMGILCTGVHLYYVPMTGILLLSAMVTDFIRHRSFKTVLLPVLSFAAFGFFNLWFLGGFKGGVNPHGDGAGLYVANLNSLFNPLGNSLLFRDLPVNQGNYEGKAYLGAGMFVLLAFALVLVAIAIRRGAWQRRKQHPNYAIVFGAVAAVCIALPIAFGPKITLNNNVLLSIPYPSFIQSTFTMFRASGRFIWIVYYLLIITSLVIVLRKLSKKSAVIVLSICLLLQLIDIGGRVLYLHADYTTGKIHESPIVKNELLHSLSGNANYRHVQLLDAFLQQDYFRFAEYALQNRMTTSDFYFARKNDNIDSYRKEELERIRNGVASRDTVYIASKISGIIINSPILYWYDGGDFALGVKNKVPEQENKLIPAGTLPVLSRDGKFMNQATEDTKDGRVLHADGFSFGPYITLSKGTYQLRVTGSNLDLCLYQVTAEAGKVEIPLQEIHMAPNDLTFCFTLPMLYDNCEFLLENRQQGDVTISAITLTRLP